MRVRETKGLPFPSRLGPDRREGLAFPYWGSGRPSSRTLPSALLRAPRAIQAGFPGAVGTARTGFLLPPLSFSPLPSLPSGPALRGRAGRQPLPCAGDQPGPRCPGSRDCGRKTWVASGSPGASVNPVTPKVNRVKELFSFFNDQRGLPPPHPILTPVAGKELGGVCLGRACEPKE